MMQTLPPLNQISDEERRRRLLADGERMTFNAMMMDSGSKTSIDEGLKAHIEQIAKSKGLKPSAYIASLEPKEVKTLIEFFVSKYVGVAGANGIAGAFAMDGGQTSGDPSTNAYDAMCLATGRTPIRSRDTSVVSAQIARDAQARREVNDAIVMAHVCIDSERRSSAVPRTDQRLLDAGKAAVEAVRAARFR